MGQAISLPIRTRIVEMRQQGTCLKNISELLEVPYSSTKKINKRYKEKGETGLSAAYANCGNKGVLRSSYFFNRASVWLKRHHLEWGAPLIHLLLTERYGKEDLPSKRQMQRWFKAKGLNAPRQKKGEPHNQEVHEAHERWQIDAKERLRLANGQDCTYLSVVDEYTGGSLGATLFPLFSHKSSAK
jgi:hypothetical protein